MRDRLLIFGTILAIIPGCVGQQPLREPIIDVHLHALPVTYFGGSAEKPSTICAPLAYIPGWDAKDIANYPSIQFPCVKTLWAPRSDDELMTKTIAILDEMNITAIAGGTPAVVDRWVRAKPARVLPAADFNRERNGRIPVGELREAIATRHVAALAEILAQYEGVPANSPELDPYFSLAEELDVPVGIHLGPGPPGTPYFPYWGNYRGRSSSLLLLEDVLTRHPKLRLWAMHAGWPLGDDAIAALYTHPQLYVDIGVIDYYLPRAEFYSYLKRLIDAGLGKRIMFGSDQMIWPDSIPIAVEAIQRAPFLTREQKRDILYNNAARFFRLKH